MIVLVLALAYLIGSLPFSWILIWFLKGVDLRTVGSGNPGATNALRVAGWGWGIVALVLDIGKGAAAVVLSPMVLREAEPLWLPSVCGLAAILGNIFCPWFKFRGGKAVATGAGVFLGLAPLGFVLTFLLFGVLVGWTKIISIGSLAAATFLPLFITYEWRAGFGDAPPAPVVVLVWVVAALVVARHTGNIRRLIRGEEPKFTDKAEGKDGDR
jgi:glycerol-3-phosphate acyltransferase PlsY